MPKLVTDVVTDCDTKQLLIQDPSIYLPLLDPLSVGRDVPVSTKVSTSLSNPPHVAKDSVCVHCTASIVNTHPGLGGAPLSHCHTSCLFSSLLYMVYYPDVESKASAYVFLLLLNDTLSATSPLIPYNKHFSKSNYFASKMKFKGEGIPAFKDLFLLFPALNKEIPMSLLLIRLIVSSPWQGCQEYEVMWDTSGLSFQFEKNAFMHSTVKSNVL